MSSLAPVRTETRFHKGIDIIEQISQFSCCGVTREPGTQLVSAAFERFVTRRLHQLIAVWFVLQIVLPFTAPLQTLDLHDLFGGTTHGHSRSSPESSTTPTISDTSSASGLGSLIGPAALRLCAIVLELRDVSFGRAVAPFAGPPAAPSIQHPVLRI
jgi:hypothetical protein